MGGLVIAFWNRRHNAAPHPQAEWLATPCRYGCPPWDVLILAEVRRHHAPVFGETLQPAAIRWWGEGVAGTSPDRSAHGIMILTRELELGEVERPRGTTLQAPRIDAGLVKYARTRLADADLARPLRAERWISAGARVQVPAGDGSFLRLAGWHAPYAAGRRVWDSLQNRLTKRAAYAELAAWAADITRTSQPLVLGMDGNNWGHWLDGPPVATPPKQRRNRYRQLLDDAPLFDAEHSFHEPNATHGLKDTLRSAALLDRFPDGHGSRSVANSFGHPLAVTYRLKNDVHRMDRIYASPDVDVLEAGVCHGPLSKEDLAASVKGDDLAPGSDHALVWCRISATR